jgi:hypothetical protein
VVAAQRERAFRCRAGSPARRGDSPGLRPPPLPLPPGGHERPDRGKESLKTGSRFAVLADLFIERAEGGDLM